MAGMDLSMDRTDEESHRVLDEDRHCVTDEEREERVRDIGSGDGRGYKTSGG